MQEHIDNYFQWLCNKVFNNYLEIDSYTKLLQILYSTNFVVFIDFDENRYADGINLRYRYCYECGIPSYIADEINNQLGECSLLEVMVSLALRCEEEIMSDSDYGDRTWLWFKQMLKSMHVDDCYNNNFSEDHVRNCIYTVILRKYNYNGDGGLFTVDDPPNDLRKEELYTQMCWWLNTINKGGTCDEVL